MVCHLRFEHTERFRRHLHSRRFRATDATARQQFLEKESWRQQWRHRNTRFENDQNPRTVLRWHWRENSFSWWRWCAAIGKGHKNSRWTGLFGFAAEIRRWHGDVGVAGRHEHFRNRLDQHFRFGDQREFRFGVDYRRLECATIADKSAGKTFKWIHFCTWKEISSSDVHFQQHPASLPNCRQLHKDFRVSWEVFGPQITFELAGQVMDDEYMSFGLSGSDTSSQMLGADVAVAYIDGARGYATDYNITSLAPVSL